MSFLDIAEDVGRGTVSLIVRVQPRASKDEVAGAIAGALKIRLRAPNDTLVMLLAGLLKRPKSAVRIQSGEHGRTKRVEIQGVTRQQILDLLRVEA